jgi:pimeloyl-ACP methyl ester carboxylesterase
MERGQGQPLVLLHGNGTLAQELEISGLPGLAAEKYRVIAFDRPGYGYSDRPRGKSWTPEAQAELLHRALQYLGIEQPIVVGHSWASLVAVALALRQPDCARGLVLLSGYYYPTPRMDAVLLSPPAIPVIGDLMRYTISPLLGRAIWPAMKWKLFSPSSAPERFENQFPLWMTLRPLSLKASAAEAGLMVLAAARLSARYRELEMPMIIMAGAGDLHATPKRHSERLHRELPHSELIVVPGAGHMFQHVAPERVIAAIDKAADMAPLQPAAEQEEWQRQASG